MPTGTCPECEADVHVDVDADKGETVDCDECGMKLEVVGLDPVELDPEVRRVVNVKRLLKAVMEIYIPNYLRQSSSIEGLCMAGKCVVSRHVRRHDAHSRIYDQNAFTGRIQDSFENAL